MSNTAGVNGAAQATSGQGLSQLLGQMQQGVEQNSAMTAAGIQSSGAMAMNGMAASNAASQMNEMMNQQAMINNMRKAASELIKGAV